MTILSASKKKAVNITRNHGKFIAAYVQIDQENQREQLIEMKSYKTEKAAINWAKKQLF
jgi:hypothetical protein